LEGRAIYELQAMFWTWPLLQLTARGDGHPVMVLPGFGAGDLSTAPLRRFLQSRGYAAYPWDLGVNTGPAFQCERNVLRRVKEIHAEHGRKVSLVGWSLGGVYARELGRVAPDYVRQVITLGSPLHDNPRANNAWRLYEFASGEKLDAFEDDLVRRRRAALQIPITSIYSRGDGVVAWECSLEPEGPLAENVEVISSHMGLGFNPLVLNIIADRLAQPEGAWQPFEATGCGSVVYGTGRPAPNPVR
jgi:hypothetical protein